jgi:hypothetical protein
MAHTNAQPCLKLSRVKVDKKALHQNSTSRVELIFEGRNCYVFNGAPDQLRQWPDFDIQGDPGLDVRVTARGASHFDQTTVHDGTFKAQQISVTLEVAVAPGSAQGEHKLPGQLRYKVMDGPGNVSEETLTFAAPLKVEGPNKPAGPDFIQRHPVWARVLLPFEIIAIIPLYLIDTIFLGWDGC